MQPGRGPTEVALLGHGHEVPQPTQIDTTAHAPTLSIRT